MVDTSAAGLLRRVEGFRAEPYWDVNAWRIGYGSDTITLPDGSVQRVSEGTPAISRDDAARDLDRRIPEFVQQGIVPFVGQASWDRLPAATQAAITSVAYNYGSLDGLPTLVGAIRAGDAQEIARAVSSRGIDNGGVNAGRRDQEAAIIAANPIPPIDVGGPPVPQNPSRYIDEQRLRYEAANNGPSPAPLGLPEPRPLSPSDAPAALTAARQRLAAARAAVGKAATPAPAASAPPVSPPAAAPVPGNRTAIENGMGTAAMTGLGATLALKPNGSAPPAAAPLPVQQAQPIRSAEIIGTDVTPRVTGAALGGGSAAGAALKPTGGSTATGSTQTNNGVVGTAQIPAGVRPASVGPAPVQTGGLSPTERDEKKTKTVTVANPAYAAWEKTYGQLSEIHDTREDAQMRAMGLMPPVEKPPPAPARTITKTVADTAAPASVPAPAAAPQTPIYESGGYIYLQRPDGSYARQGRAEVSGNNVMGAMLKAGVEKAGLNYGGPWNGVDEARAQLMLNPEGWAKGAALQPAGSGAALQPTDAKASGSTYTAGGYLYARAPDGSFKKVGKANGTPQPTSNASRLETQAQGDISTGFTSGTQRGEGAANIAQKVRSGQMSLQAAMAQGYKPPPAALAA